MTRDELIAAAMAQAGAVEDYPFGESLLTVKVGGKIDDDGGRDLIASSYAAVVAGLPKRRRPSASG
jgi:predicted DNA-binding protein (MmcQ/YjbR family)